MIDDSQAAAYGLLVVYAMDQYVGASESLTPPPDPRLAPRYRILGYLTGTDTVFRRSCSIVGVDIVCYGYVAEDTTAPGTYVAVIRGTHGVLEWIEDAEFFPTPHPKAGLVESGFWGIYQSLEYRGVGDQVGRPAAAGIDAVVGPGSVTVIGHSLGAPIATYLAFDLANPARLGDRVRACLFASPRPGDAGFGGAFNRRVSDYRVFNYELDVVPRIPRGPDYTDLPAVTWIGIVGAKSHIKFDLACHHHVLSYCSMLDYGLLDWANLPQCDRLQGQCIKGPAA